MFLQWAGAMLTLLLSTLCLSALSKKRKKLRSLPSDQRGSITIQFVMLLPFVIGALLMVMETTNFMIATIGLRYAAANTVRSAVVWLPAEVDNEILGQKRMERIHQAAVRSWMPYLPGHMTDNHYAHWERSSAQDFQGIASAWHDNQIGQAKESYLRRQHALADQLQVRLTIEERSDPITRSRFLSSFDGKCLAFFSGRRPRGALLPMARVKLRAPVPFKTSLIGRLFGQRLRQYQSSYYRFIEIEFDTPLETPLSSDGLLGINHFYQDRI